MNMMDELTTDLAMEQLDDFVAQILEYAEANFVRCMVLLRNPFREILEPAKFLDTVMDQRAYTLEISRALSM